MADISKITLPSGDTYDLKDAYALRLTTEFTPSTFSGVTWAYGSISSADGTVQNTSTSRLNSPYLPLAVAKITPLTGYRFTLAAYDQSEVYQGLWSGSVLEKSATWHRDAVDLTKIGNYKFRICLARDPSSSAAMDLSEGDNVVLTTSVDAMVYYQNFLLSKIAGFTIYDGTVV